MTKANQIFEGTSYFAPFYEAFLSSRLCSGLHLVIVHSSTEYLSKQDGEIAPWPFLSTFRINNVFATLPQSLIVQWKSDHTLNLPVSPSDKTITAYSECTKDG
jgi:hypothetical protein